MPSGRAVCSASPIESMRAYGSWVCDPTLVDIGNPVDAVGLEVSCRGRTLASEATRSLRDGRVGPAVRRHQQAFRLADSSVWQGQACYGGFEQWKLALGQTQRWSEGRAIATM